MAIRTVPTSASTPPITGPNYMDAVSNAFGVLFNASCLPLTSIGGTANAITATLDPPLTTGLADGMSFLFTPAANNTGATTIAINGGTAQAIRDSAGVALPANILVAGTQVMIVWNAAAGHYRILNSTQVVKIVAYQAFTASGTWNKPAGTLGSALIIVECIGAGGGGVNSSGIGGGGGGRVLRILPASAVGSSVTVTVGAGGANGTSGSQGGASSFGSLVIAYGGGGAAAPNGGGGGGAKGPGLSTGAPGGPAGGTSTNRNGVGGGHGSDGTGAGGDGYEGGGGGGAGTAGGSSVYGGGAGGTTGGTSTFAGNGGNTSQAGFAPGGGGGGGASGARGEVRVWVMG